MATFQTEPSLASVMGGVRILVVDGDESTHRSVRAALGGRRYEVE